MSPIVHRLESEFDGEVVIHRLDVDQPDNAQIQRAYDMRGHPTFALLDQNGEVANRYFGVVDEGILRQDMEKLIP